MNECTRDSNEKMRCEQHPESNLKAASIYEIPEVKHLCSLVFGLEGVVDQSTWAKLYDAVYAVIYLDNVRNRAKDVICRIANECFPLLKGTVSADDLRAISEVVGVSIEDELSRRDPTSLDGPVHPVELREYHTLPKRRAW